MFKSVLRFIGTIVVVFIAWQCSKSPDYVAKIEDEGITTEDLKKVLEQQFHTTDFSTISLENKQRTLRELIDYRLKVIHAKQLNLDQNDSYKSEIGAKLDKLIATKLYEREVIEAAVPEDEVKTIFELRQYELGIDALAVGYAGASKNRVNRTKREAVARAEEAAGKLRSGEDVAILVERYNDDPNIAHQKGKIDPYQPALLHPALDNELINMNVGDVAGPVVTEKAVYVIRLNRKESSSQSADFEDRKDAIVRELFRRYYSDEGKTLYEQKTRQYKDELGWEISDEAISKFIVAVKNWAEKPDPRDDQFSESERGLLLGFLGDHKITAGYFVDQFRGQFFKNYGRYLSESEFKNTLDQQLSYYAWVETARKRGLENDPEIAGEISRQKNLKLAELLELEEIRKKASFTEEEVRQYYEKEKQKYMEPEKIRIREISVRDEKLAQEIFSKASKSSADFEKLAAKYTEKAALKKRGGDMGFQSRKSSLGSDIMEKAFSAGPNAVFGPVKRGVYYYIIKTGEVKPERQKKLEEIRSLVESGLKRSKERELREKMMQELHENYSYSIDESKLEQLS